MILRGLSMCMLLAVTACGPRNNDGIPAGRSDTRQQPSNTTPGIHLSGYVNVGVVRNF